MRQSWPGLYVPFVPGKKIIGNKDVKFIIERRYFLERFFMQMSRYDYLLAGPEYAAFGPVLVQLLQATLPPDTFTALMQQRRVGVGPGSLGESQATSQALTILLPLPVGPFGRDIKKHFTVVVL